MKECAVELKASMRRLGFTVLQLLSVGLKEPVGTFVYKIQQNTNCITLLHPVQTEQ